VFWDGTNLTVNGAINVGSFTGYAWPASGQTGAHLSSAGLLLGNANDGKYFQFDTATGNVSAPQFSIVNGAATFSGSLSAATGTFSGNLNAAGGTFSGTLTAQTVDTSNLVGAAVTTTTIATVGGVSTQRVMTVTAPAGSSALVILAYQGLGSSVEGETATTPLHMDMTVNGTNVGTFSVFGMYCIQSPSGTYSISISNCQSAIALLTKR
jgi:hypothetical protein